MDSCEQGTEVCRNTAGAYECDTKCQQGYRYDKKIRTCLGKESNMHQKPILMIPHFDFHPPKDTDECKEGTHECQIDKERCVNVPGSYQCHQLHSDDGSNCPPGYEANPQYTFLCRDRDECTSGLHTCSKDETCVNEQGGYRCEGGLTSTMVPDYGFGSESTEGDISDNDDNDNEIDDGSDSDDDDNRNTVIGNTRPTPSPRPSPSPRSVTTRRSTLGLKSGPGGMKAINSLNLATGITFAFDRDLSNLLLHDAKANANPTN